MKRSVIRSTSDHTDKKRRLFMLDCGHTVSRRGSSDKLWADCPECDRRRQAWEQIKARAIFEDKANVGDATRMRLV